MISNTKVVLASTLTHLSGNCMQTLNHIHPPMLVFAADSVPVDLQKAEISHSCCPMPWHQIIKDKIQ